MHNNQHLWLFGIIKILTYLAIWYYICVYTLDNPKTSKEVNTGSNLTTLNKWTVSLINDSSCYFPTKREQIWESNKIFSPKGVYIIFFWY